MTLISLFILGLVLSLDNARLAVALGAYRLSWGAQRMRGGGG